MEAAQRSYPLECCECGVAVGTEGPQRGTLLLPCQHILHMGCVEFIRRRGKLLMGMDTSDVLQDDNTTPQGEPFSQAGSSSSSSWMHRLCGGGGGCVCPACHALVAQMIPLYLRSEDDPSAVPKAARTADEPAEEDDFRRVHAAQKRVLLRLRGLCEQRRRMTELTRSCASLHEQRAAYLAEVEKEERCFPGLADNRPETTTHGVAKAESGSVFASSSSSSSPAVAGPPIESMGITELELYMAQITPRLLRTQAEVRKERQLLERRSKKLAALRSHYHSTKELRALDAEIAERHARLHGDGKREAPPPPPPPRSAAVAALVGPGCAEDASARSPQRTPVKQEAASAATPLSSSPPARVPARKKMRGETAIDVDDVPPAEVVEVLSGPSSDDEKEEVVVMVLDSDDDGDDGRGRHAERRRGTAESDQAEEGMADGSATTLTEVDDFEAPFLIPCYVRPASVSGAAGSSTKAPQAALTHSHLRMLPRREDRLWQPSLQF